METEYILTVVGFVVSLLLGFAAKKFKYIEKNFIPIQNLAVGFIMAVIEYILTKDFHTAVALSGLMAGGSFDIVHNINKLGNDENKK